MQTFSKHIVRFRESAYAERVNCRGCFQTALCLSSAACLILLLNSFLTLPWWWTLFCVCVWARQTVHSSVKKISVQSLVKYKGKPNNSARDQFTEYQEIQTWWSFCVLIQCTFLPPSSIVTGILAIQMLRHLINDSVHSPRDVPQHFNKQVVSVHRDGGSEFVSVSSCQL